MGTDAPFDLRLLPRSATVDADGRLSIAGCDLAALADTFGTPLYVYDEDELRARCREYRARVRRRARSRTRARRSSALAMARLVAEEGLHLDVATGGELHVALRAGFPAARIVFHGNNKSEPSCGRARARRRPHRRRLVRRARPPRGPRRRRARPAPRARARHARASRRTPTSTSRPAPTTRSSGSPSRTAPRATPRCRVAKSDALDLAGFHCHIGSQILRLDSYARAAAIVGRARGRSDRRGRSTDRRAQPRRRPRRSVHLPTTSTRRRSPTFASFVRTSYAGACAKFAGLDPAPRLAVEAGRSIAGPAGITLYTVGTIKEIPGVRTYVAVDGGMSDNPRPVTYGARYEAFLPARAAAPPTLRRHASPASTASRATCSSATPTSPPIVAVGDLLATPVTGAYGYSMASNYNKVPRPAVVFVRDGDAARRRAPRDARRPRVSPRPDGRLIRTMQERVRVGLLGCGNVGTALVRLIHDHADVIEARSGVPLEVARVAVRNLGKDRGLALPARCFTDDAASVVGDPDVDVVVEVIGGIEPARTLIVEALKAGKPVVTANKELLATHGRELFETAEGAGVDLLFEASVAGGIPLIRPLRESLAGDRIRRVMGIVNGTTNYILTRMTETAPRSPTRSPRRRPRVRGTRPHRRRRGVRRRGQGRDHRVDRVRRARRRRRRLPRGHHRDHADDIASARDLGYVVKLLAVAEELDGEVAVRVHPAMVPERHPLASVRDSFNAVFIEGDAVGELMLYGRGAGGGTDRVGRARRPHRRGQEPRGGAQGRDHRRARREADPRHRRGRVAVLPVARGRRPPGRARRDRQRVRPPRRVDQVDAAAGHRRRRPPDLRHPPRARGRPAAPRSSALRASRRSTASARCCASLGDEE